MNLARWTFCRLEAYTYLDSDGTDVGFVLVIVEAVVIVININDIYLLIYITEAYIQHLVIDAYRGREVKTLDIIHAITDAEIQERFYCQSGEIAPKIGEDRHSVHIQTVIAIDAQTCTDI